MLKYVLHLSVAATTDITRFTVLHIRSPTHFRPTLAKYPANWRRSSRYPESPGKLGINIARQVQAWARVGWGRGLGKIHLPPFNVPHGPSLIYLFIFFLLVGGSGLVLYHNEMLAPLYPVVHA